MIDWNAPPHPLAQALADLHLALQLTDGDQHNWRCSECRADALAAAGVAWADPDHPLIVATMNDLGGHHNPEHSAAKIADAAQRTRTATQRFLRPVR